MINYDSIKDICREQSRISSDLIDNFLISYGATRNKLADEADRQLGKYKHITRQFDPSWIRMLKSQYIGHRIFKKDGFVNKYLQHTQIKSLPPEQFTYLQNQANTPWRFSFSTIIENPETDFYQMKDIISDETFLLYSPGITSIKKEGNPSHWFNLIGFNGACWQSFGPIAHYLSFDVDDIFFFSTELNNSLFTEEDIAEYIQENPAPFMMLLCGSQLPLTVHHSDRIVYNISENEEVELHPDKMRKDFEIDSAGVVDRFRLKGWEAFPHFAALYHDRKNQMMLRISMTDRGFDSLTKKLNELGYALPPYSEIRVSPSMLITAEQILKRKMDLNPYEKLFDVPSVPAEKEELDKLNKAIGLMLPALNEGKTPDYKSISEKTGLSVDVLTDIFSKVALTTREKK